MWYLLGFTEKEASGGSRPKWALRPICLVGPLFTALPKQESPANARVTRDSAVIPRWPSAAILHIIEPEIAPCDPLTPKILA